MTLCVELFVFSSAPQSSNPGAHQSIYRNESEQEQERAPNGAADQSGTDAAEINMEIM